MSLKVKLKIEERSLVGCDAVLFGRWLPAFRETCHLHLQGIETVQIPLKRCNHLRNNKEPLIIHHCMTDYTIVSEGKLYSMDQGNSTFIQNSGVLYHIPL